MTPLQLFNAARVDIEAYDATLLSEFDGERQSDIAEADNRDCGIVVRPRRGIGAVHVDHYQTP
jgi:hypothetical protein